VARAKSSSRLRWRHLTPDDLPRASDLLRQALVHDHLTPAGVRHLLIDDPGFDPALTRTVEDGGRLVGIAVGAAPDEQLQAPGGIKLFAVAPSHRRRGIGTRLLDEVEGALRARGVASCVALNCGTNRLALGLDVRYTAALCLLWQRGYERTGTTQDMVVDFTSPDAADLLTGADEARLLAGGVAFRRASAADRLWVEEGVREGLAASVPSRRWAYLAGLAFRPDPPSIEVAYAQDTGAFLGFAAYDVARAGALGPMGVIPDARQGGVGSVLLKRCLRDLRGAGYERGEIFAVGPIPFYARVVGARMGRVYYQYARSL
jgi:mycothiol synthase